MSGTRTKAVVVLCAITFCCAVNSMAQDAPIAPPQ